MTSLFGSYAIKQSLGAESILGKMHFDHPSTSSVSIAPMRNDATPLPSSEKPPSSKRASLEEQLFEARATAKILASRVAMYMEDEWRRKLYRQLDSLLDVDEWMEGERPLVGDRRGRHLARLRPGLRLDDPQVGLVVAIDVPGAALADEGDVRPVRRPGGR